MVSKRKINEKSLYPRIEKFLLNTLKCNWVLSELGSNDVGRVDVVGIKSFKDRFSNRYEIIGVEVKPKTFHFGKKIGQALAYSLFANRVYLACHEEFSQSQIELASRLGVGLIQIKSKAGCSEVIGSKIFDPDREKMLNLLTKMSLAECMLCNSLIDLEKNYSNNLPRAISRGIPFEFYRKIDAQYAPSYKGKKKIIFQWLYVCPSCLKLFGKHTKFK